MLEEKVKGLLKAQNKRVKDLCDYIQVTDTGLRKMYARDSCETAVLIKIANFFAVSPCYFFQEDGRTAVSAGDGAVAVGGNANNVNSFRAIQEMVAEISAQRKLTEQAMQQIQQLVGVIADLSKRN